MTALVIQFTSGEELHNMISQCVLHILQNYVREPKKIAIWYGNDQKQELIVRDLFQNSDIPIMINALETPMTTTFRIRLPSDVAVILNEKINVTYHLENNLFTAETIFLTVVWEGGNTSRIFREYWNFNVVKTYTLEVQEGKIYMYHFKPYVNCDMSEPKKLDTWNRDNFILGDISSVGEKFTVTNLNGCTYNVSVTHIPPTVIFPDSKIHGSYLIDGMEGRIVRTVSEVLNCTFLYKVADDGEKWGYIKPRTRGPLGEVFDRKSLIAFGAPAPTVERLTYLDAVVGTSQGSECVTWVVPVGAAKNVPVWLRIFVSEFSLETWSYFAGVFVLTVLTHYAFSRVTNSKSTQSLFDSFLYILSCSLGTTVRFQRSIPNKVLISAWIWYALIITTAYESSMKSKLTIPLRHKDIDTLQELHDSNLDLYGVGTTIKIIYKENENPIESAIGRRAKPTNLSIDDIVTLIMTRKVGYLREYTTFSYNAYSNTKAIGKLHKVKQCAYTYFPAMFLQKRCPITPIVNRVVDRLREAGILHFWRSLFLRESSEYQPAVVKLTMEHMAAPFLAYGVCMIIAIIVFILEIIRLNNWKLL